MHWIVFVLALVSVPLLAFFAWLGFNLILVRWHGLKALDKTPQLYRFNPRDWTVRQLPVDPAQPPPAQPQPPNQLPPAV